ncbi:pyruvyl-transferase domain-containing protein [Listeria seeligeri FSL S4-171]|nr:pyruvyl-transferase domain-containing protein [Listeria seeligeri FSL S4-171]
MLERIHISANLLEERQDFKLRYNVNRVNDQLNQLKKSFSEERAKFKQKLATHQEKNTQLEITLTQTEQKLQIRIDENQKLNTQIKYYKGTLNRKAVRISLTIADSLAMVKGKIRK